MVAQKSALKMATAHARQMAKAPELSPITVSIVICGKRTALDDRPFQFMCSAAQHQAAAAAEAVSSELEQLRADLQRLQEPLMIELMIKGQQQNRSEFEQRIGSKKTGSTLASSIRKSRYGRCLYRYTGRPLPVYRYTGNPY